MPSLEEIHRFWFPEWHWQVWLYGNLTNLVFLAGYLNLSADKILPLLWFVASLVSLGWFTYERGVRWGRLTHDLSL